MPVFQWFITRIALSIDKHGWKVAVGIFLGLFLVSWFFMMFFEPKGSPIVDTYWWYYLVTASTVGYGDMTPTTVGGRVVGLVIIFGSVTAFGVLTAQLITFMSNFAAKIRSGTMHLDEEEHVIILGYNEYKTERIIEELHADPVLSHATIVLAFDPSQATEDPLPHMPEVRPAKGKLSSPILLKRVCATKAHRVIVDGQNDDETLAICLMVNQLNQTAHIVAALHSLDEYAEKIHLIRPSIECVPTAMVTMIVQATQDPGITRLYGSLLSNLTGSAGFRVHIPEGAGEWEFYKVLLHFKKNYNATIIASAASHDYAAAIHENPAWDEIIQGGMSLYYIAPKRLEEVDWKGVNTT